MEIVSVFSSFSVDNLDEAREFYEQKLGLEVSGEEMGLTIELPDASRLFIYPKDDHQPATFTVLNFVVTDIDAAVEELSSRGIEFEHYDQDMLRTDQKGIARDSESGVGPDIAWFKDPAGNILSLVED